MNTHERIGGGASLQLPHFTMRNFLVGSAAIAAGAVAMALIAIAVGGGYHWFAYGGVGAIHAHAGGGFAVGLFYAVPFVFRREYTIPAYLAVAHRPTRIFMSWNAAFLALLTLAFLTQTTVALSRVTVVAFYVIGLVAMVGIETAIRSVIIAGLRSERLAPRRVMLVGHKTATAEFMMRLAAAVPEAERIGVRVVAISELPRSSGDSQGEGLKQALDQAVATARMLLPDEVVIVTPWDESDRVDAAVEAFEQLPIAIHLDGGAVLSRYSDVSLRRVGSASTLSVAELPLSPVQVILKRLFDIVVASIGLILTAPIFAVTAFMIRRDGPGPVFFVQDRLGFNQQAFRIYKFRTMTTADNGPVIVQATKNDPRITRVGKFLRRTSLDELPQLLNVLKGDMSIVGPRPHAVAHDRTYEARIRRYPRRLNMKPGITGWAQVNGFRGETDTDDKMRRRVEYDLYYIDNWSILFDVYIVVLTLISPRTFNNAR